MTKGYWAASGKFLKGVGKPREMPKYLQPANRRGERISQWLLAKTWQFASLFSEGLHFCFHFLKVKGSCEKLLKCSAALFPFLLFPTILLLARLKLVRQSL
jgi:hypothetical protein